MNVNEFLKSLNMKIPRIEIEGKKLKQRDFIPISPNPITTETDLIMGNIDLDFQTPSGVQFGGGISPFFVEGETNFPQDLQKMGAPASQKFGSGLSLRQMRAYLGLPIDDTSSVRLDTRFEDDISKPTGANITFEKRF